MKKDKKEKAILINKLLDEIKQDVKSTKHMQPRRYREQVDYFKRQATARG